MGGDGSVVSGRVDGDADTTELTGKGKADVFITRLAR